MIFGITGGSRLAGGSGGACNVMLIRLSSSSSIKATSGSSCRSHSITARCATSTTSRKPSMKPSLRRVGRTEAGRDDRIDMALV